MVVEASLAKNDEMVILLCIVTSFERVRQRERVLAGG